MTQNGARIHQNALNRLKWLPDSSQRCKKSRIVALWAVFGSPPWAPESAKNRSLAPKGAPGSDFLSIFRANSVFLTFGLEFSWIFDDLLIKKSMHCFKAACNFFNMAIQAACQAFPVSETHQKLTILSANTFHKGVVRKGLLKLSRQLTAKARQFVAFAVIRHWSRIINAPFFAGLDCPFDVVHGFASRGLYICRL